MIKSILIMKLYNIEDTITAIATPSGDGGVAIIRVSGSNALSVVGKIFSKNISTLSSHTLNYGKILDEHKNKIDDVLLAVMLAPNSYTGEDVLEINCHGGRLITEKILRLIIKNGARLALPGEFTYRAFLNKKIDLTQAEAVQNLISSQNETALKYASKQLQGDLSKKILTFKKGLIEVAANLEAWIDFPEDGLEFTTVENIVSELQATLISMQKLSSTFSEGKIVRDGCSLCLIGAPNVGKSSLMNALLCENRSIVTPIPGTTRDTIEEDISFGGLHFRLTDTAGMRTTSDIIEKEGLKRTLKALESSDINLFILDCSRDVSEEEVSLLKDLDSSKTIIVWNKIDLVLGNSLNPNLNFDEIQVSISAKENLGLEELKKAIISLALKKPINPEGIVITSARQHSALIEAIENLQNTINSLRNGCSPEFAAADLKLSLNALNNIMGSDLTEDVLSAVFSKFCVGK